MANSVTQERLRSNRLDTAFFKAAISLEGQSFRVVSTRVVWDMFLLLIQIYYLISIPFRCCLIRNFALSKDFSTLITCDVVAAVSNIVEFYLMVRYAHVPVYGKRRRRKDSKNQETFVEETRIRAPNNSWIGSPLFFLSVLSIFPFEVVGELSSADNICWYYVPRLIGTARIPDLLNVFYTVLEEKKVLINIGLQRMWSLFMTMSVMGHICGCAFYLASLLDAEARIDPTWGANDGLWKLSDTPNTQDPAGNVVFLEPMGVRYLRSVYWAFVTMVTTGFGDIVPVTANETAVCVISMYIGMAITGTCIANLTLVVTNLDAAASEYQQKMDNLSKYMTYRNMPIALSSKIRRFYEYMWMTLKGVDEKKFLRDLPRPLQQRVYGLLTKDLLRRVNAFRKLPPTVFRTLINCLEQHVYSPGDIIIEKGTQAKGLMLLARGTANIMSPNDKSVQKVIKKSEHVGVESLFDDEAATKSMKAKSYCEIYILPKDKFREIVKIHCQPHETEEIKKVINLSIANSKKVEKFAGDDSAVIVRGIAVHWLPDSKFRLAWKFLRVIILLYYLFSIPIHLIYAADDADFGNAGRLFSMLIDCLTDIYFIADFVLQLNYFAFVRDGVVVRSPYMIRSNFLMRGRFQIFILVITAFPFDYIALVAGLKSLSALRMLKTLHLLKLKYAAQDLKKVIEAFRLNIPTVIRRAGGLNLALVVVCHWVGCSWLLIGSLNQGTEVSNWINNDISRSDFNIKSHSEMLTGFIRSVYFALVAMSTVGYGDIVPQNHLETLCSVLVVLIGGLILPAVVGGLAALLSKLNPSMTEFRNKMDHLKLYMEQKQLNVSLKQKIIRYYDYLWSRQGGVNESEIMNDLPGPLRSAVANCINGDRLRHVPFFAPASEKLLRFLVSELTPRTFLPNDLIVEAGTTARTMFLIERGALKVCSHNRDVQYATLSAGDYFGESAFLEDSECNATIVAVSYCDCFCLTSESFYAASEYFPDGCKEVLDNIRSVQKRKTVSNDGVVKNFDGFEKLRVAVGETDASGKGSKAGRGVSEKWNPESRFRSIWNVLMIGIVLYNAIVIPFRIAFQQASSLLALDWIFDILLLVDVYFNMYRFGYMFEGMLHHDSHDIAKRYKSMKIFFYSDVLAAIPFEILGLLVMAATSSPAAKVLPFVRLPKLFRLSRIVDYVSDFNITFRKHSFFIGISTIKLAELLVGVVLVAHWAGCFFYFCSWIGIDSAYCDSLDNIQLSAETGMTQRAGCLYGHSWIRYQINNGLLPPDGGTTVARYIRSLNWALPTLVVVVIGDVVPINPTETLYCLIWMYLGVTINAVIIGNIANLVANLETEGAAFVHRMDKIKDYMHHNEVPIDLQNKVHNYLDFIWSSKGGINETNIIEDLPVSLKTSVTDSLRLSLVKRCPFFESCSEAILRDIACVLELHSYSRGDVVVEFGEMGTSMYLVQSGSMDVVGSDGVTYATMPSGSFFGERALFNNLKRSATVRSNDFSELLVLEKEDFDQILTEHKFNYDDMYSLFLRVQKRNKTRDEAVSKNILASSKDGTKLNKMFQLPSEAVLTNTSANRGKAAERHVWFSYNSNFRAGWDFIRIFGTMFYAISIPLLVAFYEDGIHNLPGLLAFGYVVDVFFIVNIYFQDQQFSFFETGKVINDPALIKKNYRSNHAVLDILTIFPFDTLAYLILGNSNVAPFLRIPRLFQLRRLPSLYEKVDEYMHKWRIHMSTAVTKLIQTFTYFLLLNHWFACNWIVVYRYFEGFDSNTWAGHDTLSNNGQPILQRYVRAFYFVITTLSTVGYGDIRPWTQLETIFELIVVVTAACVFAGIIGQLTAFFQYLDGGGHNAFKMRMTVLRNYMSYREMPDNIQSQIIDHHTNLWMRKNCMDEYEITQDLPIPLRMDIAVAVNSEVLRLCPEFNTQTISLQRRIALRLKPQLCSPGTLVYDVGDIGYEVYFVGKGTIRRTIPKNIEKDDCSLTSKAEWYNCTEISKGVIVSGEYFGEEAMASMSGVRNDSIYTLSYSELYSLSRDALDNILTSVPGQERVTFLRNLLRVSGELEEAKIKLQRRRSQKGELLFHKRHHHHHLHIDLDASKRRVHMVKYMMDWMALGKGKGKYKYKGTVLPVDEHGIEDIEAQQNRIVQEIDTAMTELTVYQISRALITDICANPMCEAPLESVDELKKTLCTKHMRKAANDLRRRSSITGGSLRRRNSLQKDIPETLLEEFNNS